MQAASFNPCDTDYFTRKPLCTYGIGMENEKCLQAGLSISNYVGFQWIYWKVMDLGYTLFQDKHRLFVEFKHQGS